MSLSCVDVKYSPAISCPKCFSQSTELAPGRGPHFARVICASCGAFVKWAPKPQSLTLTGAQRAYLLELGHQDAMPATREEGARLIASYLHGERW